MDTYRNTDPSPTPDDRSTRAIRAYAWFEVHHQKVAVGCVVTACAIFCAAAPLIFALFLAVIAGLASIAGTVVYAVDREPLAFLITIGLIVVTVASVCVVESLEPSYGTSPACECPE